MTEYNELIDTIVAKMISVIGKDKALAMAGIHLTSDGTFPGSATIKDLDTLTKNYVKVAGSIAKVLMKGSISSKIKGKTIDLPEELR